MKSSQDELTSRVEISVKCRNLKDMDVFSKSDPMAVLFQKFNDVYMETGRTEIIRNNLNPTFVKCFEIDYHFEQRQLFKIEIYDVDSKSTRLCDHEFLGKFEFSLGELASRKKLEAKLVNNKSQISGKPQFIILTCNELPGCKESIILQISGNKMDKKDFLGKSDPILQVYRSNNPITFIPGDTNTYNVDNFMMIYESKPIMCTLNPQWPEFIINLNRLCYGDKDRLIKLVCTDWNSNGTFKFIGHCFTSINHLLENKGGKDSFKLINVKKLKKKTYKNSGTMTVNKALIQTDFSFFDYISGGTELNFTVAIDFTASNGNQNNPGSLHFTSENAISGMENQYETAIISVGSIIQDYDTDKLFPALGFGARIPPNNEVSHCFPINFCLENPFCQGVDGLLNSYRSAIRLVKLFGPTNFAPSIRHVQQFAMNLRDGSKYFVLLIITDGIITDLEDTKEAIIDCSFLPMSIIIIGVGNEDFSAMDILDCDKGRLKSGYKVADRDIVQFVALRDFINPQNRSINQAALSKAVLFELPDQVTEWMKHNSIVPSSSNVRASIRTTTIDDPTPSIRQKENPFIRPYTVHIPSIPPYENPPYPAFTNSSDKAPSLKNKICVGFLNSLDNAQSTPKNPPYPSITNITDNPQSTTKNPPYPPITNFTDKPQSTTKNPPYPPITKFTDKPESTPKNPPYLGFTNLTDKPQSLNKNPPYPPITNPSDKRQSTPKNPPYPPITNPSDNASSWIKSPPYHMK